VAAPRRSYTAGMADAGWDDRPVAEQIQAWQAAIRKAVTAMPPEDRTTGPEVIRFLLGEA